MSSQAKLPSETGVAEQLEIDQLAEAEVGKHQKQVGFDVRIIIILSIA